MKSEIDFYLYRDERDYRLVRSRVPPDLSSEKLRGVPIDEIEDRIVGNGGRLVPDKPLSKVPELYKIFAKIRTPEAALNFVKNYGRFGRPDPKGDSVQKVLGEAKEMSKRMNRLITSRFGANIPLTELSGVLVSDRRSGGVELKIRPATLRDAMWLQLARSISDSARIRKCNFCKEWFRAGLGTDRRADAKFCSDEHRKRFNSLARSR
jgi:hypothetical protein